MGQRPTKRSPPHHLTQSKGWRPGLLQQHFRGFRAAASQNLTVDRRLCDCSIVLFWEEVTPLLRTPVSPVADEVAADISQPGGAEVSDQWAPAPRLCSSGNFGSGWAGLGNMRARKSYRIEPICVPCALAGVIRVRGPLQPLLSRRFVNGPCFYLRQNPIDGRVPCLVISFSSSHTARPRASESDN